MSEKIYNNLINKNKLLEWENSHVFVLPVIATVLSTLITLSLVVYSENKHKETLKKAPVISIQK